MITIPNTTRMIPVARFNVLGAALLAKTAAIRAQRKVNRTHSPQIRFICGFIGAGGGMMMLLILTSVLGYELKTAVGTSVFIMTFTALTGAVSRFFG